MNPAANTPGTLLMALPKGRMADQALELMAAAGLPLPAGQSGRKLILNSADGAMRYVLSKPTDVPTFVEYGAADLGIVGRDVLLERGADLSVVVETGLGRCRMMVAMPADFTGVAPGHTLRVASKYPRIAAAHYAARHEDVEVIFVQGSVETAPLAGLSDVIVDLVETGETLRQNGLVARETVCEVSAVLVANRARRKLRRDEVAALGEALSLR